MRLSASAVAAALFTTGAWAEAPRVVADVAPIHSLVAQVMQGVGEPTLLIPARVSPHGHALKVSQARVLSDADVVFWVGEALTPWLEKALETLADDDAAVELLDVDGITMISGDEAHQDDEHDDHGHEGADPHIWLDPENAVVLIRAIAEELAERDAENAGVYRDNAAAKILRLNGVSAEIADLMAPLKGQRYIVYHDAYRYFENRFGLGRAIPIAGSHAVKPGARRISEIKQILRDTPTRCVFSEQQFGAKPVASIVRGTEARSAELDPLGSALTPGPDLYNGMIRALAKSISDCLK